MDQAARVQVDQWTGWPVTEVAGGPVELGGLQPLRCFDLLFNNLVDMPGQAVRVQVIWGTRCTFYQANRNYMIEHIYCMIMLRLVFSCSCFGLLGSGTSSITCSMQVLHSRFLDTFLRYA